MIFRSAPTGIVLVAAFFTVVVLTRTTLPLIDGDVWWHIRAGETVLADGAVPGIDSWTIAGQGKRWTSQDWLSNVAMAALFRIDGGWGGTLLSLAFGGVVVVAFALLWDAIRRRSPQVSWVARVLLLTAGLIVAAPVLGVRVQTLDLVMTAVTVWLLWGYLVDRRLRRLVGLPIATVAWANLHAGWPLLFVLAGAVLVGEAADRVWGRSVGGRPPLSWSQIASLGVALAISVPALMLNPNGVDLLQYPLETASIGAHRDFIFEWSRPDLTSFPGQVLFAFLLGVVVPTLIVGRRRLRSVDVLWLVGLTALSLGAIRFVLIIGPVAAAVAAISLAPELGSMRPLRRPVALFALLQRPPRAARLSVINLVLAAIITLSGLGAALGRVTPDAQASSIIEAMPTRATAWLASRDADAQVFNVYAWGGYIGREMPGGLVYIDGRSDIYGDASIREYARAVALDVDPAALLDRSRIDAVVFWPTGPLANWLDAQSAWSREYKDEQAAVWVRSDQ